MAEVNPGIHREWTLVQLSVTRSPKRSRSFVLSFVLQLRLLRSSSQVAAARHPPRRRQSLAPFNLGVADYGTVLDLGFGDFLNSSSTDNSRAAHYEQCHRVDDISASHRYAQHQE